MTVRWPVVPRFGFPYRALLRRSPQGCNDWLVATLSLETDHGPAHAHLHEAASPRGVLVLGHGAGGGVGAPDLVGATAVALSADISVALVEQPYRVAGRRSPAPAWQLDVAWMTVVEQLRAQWSHSLPVVVGGRSSGARVACRTAGATNAAGVLCLAFPLQPPQGTRPEPRASRLPELDIVSAPTLVVQGERDRFGIPPDGPRRAVVRVAGDHSLRNGLATAAPIVEEWLRRLVEP